MQLLVSALLLCFWVQAKEPDTVRLQKQAALAPPARKILTFPDTKITLDSEIVFPYEELMVSPNGQYFVFGHAWGSGCSVWRRDGKLILSAITEPQRNEWNPNTQTVEERYELFRAFAINNKRVCFVSLKRLTIFRDKKEIYKLFSEKKIDDLQKLLQPMEHRSYRVQVYAVDGQPLPQASEGFSKQFNLASTLPYKFSFVDPFSFSSFSMDPQNILYLVSDSGIWVIKHDTLKLIQGDLSDKFVFLKLNYLLTIDYEENDLSNLYVNVYKIDPAAENLRQCFLRKVRLSLPSELAKIAGAVRIFMSQSGDIYVLYAIDLDICPQFKVDRRRFGEEEKDICISYILWKYNADGSSVGLWAEIEAPLAFNIDALCDADADGNFYYLRYFTDHSELWMVPAGGSGASSKPRAPSKQRGNRR